MSAPPRKTIFLGPGDFHFGKGRVLLQTVLGTCVAITLWHPRKHVGGACHILLPSRSGTQGFAGSNSGHYADEVMSLFDREIRRFKTKAVDYAVKLFGGGHMFPEQIRAAECRKQQCTDESRTLCPSIGCQNILAARRLLLANGYRIKSEDVGGHGSRQLIFDLASGETWIKRGDGVPKKRRAAS